MTSTTLDQTVQVREMIRTGEARRLRQAARISLSNLAEEIGVATTTVSFWERELRIPSGSFAVRYLQALNKIRSLAVAEHAE